MPLTSSTGLPKVGTTLPPRSSRLRKNLVKLAISPVASSTLDPDIVETSHLGPDPGTVLI